MSRDGETARRRDGKTVGRGDAGVARVLATRTAGQSAHEHVIDLDMVEIRPDPTPSERAAILIALEQMLNVMQRNGEPRPSAWALAGRRESVSGSTGRSRTAWGRGSDRLEGW